MSERQRRQTVTQHPSTQIGPEAPAVTPYAGNSAALSIMPMAREESSSLLAPGNPISSFRTLQGSLETPDFRTNVDSRARAEFSESSLRRGFHEHPSGAGNAQLREAMVALQGIVQHARNHHLNASQVGQQFGNDIKRLTQTIGEATGEDPKVLQAQIPVMFEHIERATTPSDTGTSHYTPLTPERQQLMGTEEQLMAATMIARPFEGTEHALSPSLMAMTEPTMGLVGPSGMDHHMSRQTAMGAHGVAHDAAGHLIDAYGVGPGYTYLDRERVREGLSDTLGCDPVVDRTMERLYSDPRDRAQGQVAVAGMSRMMAAEGVGEAGTGTPANDLRNAAAGVGGIVSASIQHTVTAAESAGGAVVDGAQRAIGPAVDGVRRATGSVAERLRRLSR